MAYSVGDYEFKTEAFFPKRLFDEITGVRINEPDIILKEAQSRKRRKKLTLDGKLVILATDHPGRRVTTLRDTPLGLADRFEYLGRVLRIITNPEFDGVMGTTDFIEDILIVNHLLKENGGKSFLNEKVLIGCMNRGGFAGCVNEIDDTFTSFTPESLKEMNMDGGKFMYRLDLQDPDSIKTITSCAIAINRLNELGLYSFLEPMSVKKEAGGYKILKDCDTLIKDIGAAAALGSSSRMTWLKIPYCDNYERVSRATRIPILMLGGPAGETPIGTITEFAKGMRAGANIRGAMVGRNVTFVLKEDPLAVALAVTAVIHKCEKAESAIESMNYNRGKEMDLLWKYFK